MTTSGFSILDRAHDALRSATSGVRDWGVGSPCDQWTVAQVLQHAAGDQIAYAAAITGGAGPAENPFTPSGHIEGEPAALIEEAIGRSAAAFATLSAGQADVPTPIPPHAMSAEMAAGAAAMDAAVHAWDIAVATGQASPLDDDMAAELLPVARELVEPLRGWGAFKAAIDAPAAGAAAELLLFLGRRPEWQA
ncbi:TIGR03086 family metal-binding protein [Hamadaea tsunoensis]|uniref:TIGR03086 family metal-binding protein n=1 Tax=Hamadaea tsunoensis TaxID=53368 RepID=UPI0004122E29|nr:TIGR03086 family metal-binding protein [Hamadaea tsunoensis]